MLFPSKIRHLAILPFQPDQADEAGSAGCTTSFVQVTILLPHSAHITYLIRWEGMRDPE